MKTIKILSLTALFIFAISCSTDDDSTPIIEVESNLVENLNAPQLGGQGDPISGEFC